MDKGTGRRRPDNFDHVDKYNIRGIIPSFSGEGLTVNRKIELPKGFRGFYNQKSLNACVGFSLSQLMALLNSPEELVRYDAEWLWNEAKRIDPWGDTNPGDNNGTAVASGFDVLRKTGHVKIKQGGKATKPREILGIESNYWLTTVNEMREAINAGMMIEMGTDWYPSMMEPKVKDGKHVLPSSVSGPPPQVGHAYLVTGAFDSLESFFIPNTWGEGWGEDGEQGGAYLPYKLMETLLRDGGEAGVVVDRKRGEK